jgi:5'-3' exoribonuclease 2
VNNELTRIIFLRRYPKTIKDCVEDVEDVIHGIPVPVDTSQPNPNGMEFDNLYLDMNGIIHPCFHPEDRPAPTTENEVFLAIFDYIDRLFGIVRPRKVLYMAIDGVAPRAKMNQQRSRRFRAAQDAEEQAREEQKLREELASQGIDVPVKGKSDVFDSNTITPGTPFMHRLSLALQYYIHLRLNSDPGWANVKVILSDANSPGEGEHKVMAFIREQRNQPLYDPNTRHCVYGLDADLIMLALSTHEPHFVILRELVFQQQPPSKDDKKSMAQALIHAQMEQEDSGEEQKPQIAKKPYQFLMINVLRDYLEKEMGSSVNTPFPLDKERLFDDFVFICFFVGNDFLPHMPTLEIREGAIDLLMTTYKRMLPDLGYLVDGPNVLLDRVEKFIVDIGRHEDAIFQKRMRLLRRQKNRRKNQQNNNANGNRNNAKFDSSKWGTRTPAREVAERAVAVASHMSKSARMEAAIHNKGKTNSNVDAANQLRDKMKALTGKKREGSESDDVAQKKVKGDDVWEALSKTKAETVIQDDDVKSLAPSMVEEEENKEAEEHVKEVLEPVFKTTLSDAEQIDIIKQYKETLKEQAKVKADMFDDMVSHEERIGLGQPGYKLRYYSEKLGLQPGQELQKHIDSMVKSYVEGLCWVMRYYYDGVASWTWYYPHHYAPFASDLSSIGSLDISFSLGEPFKPFDQLMGVLPAASAHALPKPYRPLFTEKTSPILDFYPTDFRVDMNGKRFAWQGVALLPFIDENRLLKATREKEKDLSEEETYRNSRRLEMLYISGAHSLAADLHELAAEIDPDATSEERVAATREMDASSSDGMGGYMIPPNGDVCPMVIPTPFSGLGEDITANSVVCCVYKLPEHQPHKTQLLPGAIEETCIITQNDIQPDPQLWHEDNFNRGGQGNHGMYQRNQQYGFQGYNQGYRPPPPPGPPMGMYSVPGGMPQPYPPQRPRPPSNNPYDALRRSRN